MKSTPIKDQKIKKVRYYSEDGTEYRITATIRHDDKCRNGHNSFSITGNIDEKKKNGQWYWLAGGCIHDDIEKHFPELKPFIKWHLTSTDGPMHYLSNTLHYASDKDCWGRGKKPDLEGARHCAIWPEATLEKLQNKGLLEARLPALMVEFQKDVNSLGLVF